MRHDADQAAVSEPGLSSMLGLSAVLHLALVVGGFVVSDLTRERRVGPVAYTVELVDARAIGGRTAPPRQARVVESPRPTAPEIPKAEKSPQKAEKSPQKVEKSPPKAEKSAPAAEKSPPRPPPPAAKKPTARETPALREKPSRTQVASRSEPAPADRAAKTEEPRDQTAKKSEASSTSSRPSGMSATEREKKIAAAIARVRDQVGTAPGVTGSLEGPGGGGIVKGVEFLIYYNRMLERIKESWAWVGGRSDLEATVRFSILESGSISALHIARSSGDPSYDASVLRAMRAAEPLPAPPPRYREQFRDVELIFRPREPGSAG